MMARPFLGSVAAMMPVRTSGILVGGAFASFTGGGGGGAPNRGPLLKAARSRGGRETLTAATGPRGSGAAPLPARWVTITAAWMPSAAARVQTASCGARAASRVPEAGRPAPSSHEIVLIIELASGVKATAEAA